MFQKFHTRCKDRDTLFKMYFSLEGVTNLSDIPQKFSTGSDGFPVEERLAIEKFLDSCLREHSSDGRGVVITVVDNSPDKPRVYVGRALIESTKISNDDFLMAVANLKNRFCVAGRTFKTVEEVGMYNELVNLFPFLDKDGIDLPSEVLINFVFKNRDNLKKTLNKRFTGG